jgi:glycosyltransferase involved in cell wall biosynthesis
MKVLFVHQNFPGQYKHIAPALAADPKNQVVAMSMRRGVKMPGVRIVVSTPKGRTEGKSHPLLAETEVKLARGEATLRSALALKREGFTPDVICAHPGWGEAMFLKDVWNAPMLGFFEFYYHMHGVDVGFDPEFPAAPNDAYRLRMKNVVNLLSLEACDRGVSPTQWQKSLHPKEFHGKIDVIHDGIDTDLIRPNPNAALKLNDSIVLTPKDEVVTFVARKLEPYRGFHVFMRALPEILRRRPNARVLIVGAEGASYGSDPEDGISYKQRALNEVGGDLDMSRVHFLGQVPYRTFLSILQVSSTHVYLTYPFVLSWSMLEAMAAGCLVIGSKTPPVEEVISHGDNGFLVDFFSPEGIVDRISEAMEDQIQTIEIRQNARRTIIDRYDLKLKCLPKHIALIDLTRPVGYPSI